MPTGGGLPTNDLEVTTIQHKRYSQCRPVIATEFEAVRTPARIALLDRYTTIVASIVSSCSRPAQQKLILSHDAINPLMVHARLPHGFPATPQQGPDATIAIARQVRDMPLNLFEQAAVNDLASTTTISPYRASDSFYCHCRARYTENVTDRFIGRPPAARTNAQSDFLTGPIRRPRAESRSP